MAEERRSGYIDISGELAEHIAEFKNFEKKVDSNWEDLTDMLEGKKVTHLGGVQQREGGLLADIDTIKKQLANGGVRIRLPAMAWGAIWVALIAGVFQIVNTLIQQAGG